MRDRILTLIDNTVDPFASEIRYHKKTCWKKFTKSALDTTLEDTMLHVQNARLSEIKQLFYQHVQMVIFDQCEPMTLKSLLVEYKKLLQNFGFDTFPTKSSHIKDLLVKEFGGKIGFHQRYRKNESTLVYDTSAGRTYLEAAINAWGVDAEQLIYAAARCLKEELADVPEMNWPPDILDLESKDKPHHLIVKLLMWLKKPMTKKIDPDYEDPAIHALASLLFSYITGKKCSFLVQMSVTLHGLTRSRELVDLLKSFALGISYNDVFSLYDSWARIDLHQNAICPKEIAEGIPGTGILDNDDFKEDTLTGGNTSHRTNVMFVQPQYLQPLHDEPTPSPSTSEKDVKIMCEELHTIVPYKTYKRGVPAVREEIVTDPESTSPQSRRSLIHTLVRSDEDGRIPPVNEQTIGSYAGFQATVQEAAPRSKQYYFLTFPKPPGKSTVHEVMKRMVAAAVHKKMPFIQLIGDQPVYALMVQLRNENPVDFKLILPFLGPFHAQCSFMSAVYKRFQGSGLGDILVATDVIAHGSVDQALRGKYYKRGIRCLTLMYESLTGRIIRRAIENDVALTDNMKDMLAELEVLLTS